MQYPDYHAQCQEMFPGNEPKINLTDFGFVVIPPTSNDNEDILKLPSNYLKLIDSLASKVNKQLENPEENCYWLKNTPQNLRDLAHYIKNPFGLSETHDIANSIKVYIINFKRKFKNTKNLFKIAKKFNWKISFNETFNFIKEIS